MRFNIPKNELNRLSVLGQPLRVPTSSHSIEAERLKILGVKWFAGDYEIFDYAYYDCLKRNGYTPSLSNMMSLHNDIIQL